MIRAACKSRRQAGFSLIELVAALAIFATVAVIAQQGMLTAATQSTKLSRQSTDLAELELAVSLVTRDLENILPRPIRTGHSATEPALTLTGDGQILTFTRGGIVDPTGRSRSPFLRVSYAEQRDGQGAVARSVWRTLDRPTGTLPRIANLWGGIQTARFQVFADGQWRKNWPPPDSEGGADLPTGIAVVLGTKKWGPIRRVVALR